MKIELRKIHYSKALSQETAAYTAEIWINGEKRGMTRNEGTGGADFVEPRSLITELEEHAKTLPPVDCLGAMVPQNMELLLGGLLDEHLLTKDLKSLLKRKLVFIARDGKLYSSRLVAGAALPKDAVSVLNTLPFDEALVLYRTHGVKS